MSSEWGALLATFVRRPRGAGEIAADAVRGLGVLSVAAAAIGWGAVEFAVMALALLGAVLPRTLGVRPALDAGFGLTVLVAAWSSVLQLYSAVEWWDLVVHFFTGGLAAVVAYILLERLGAVPDPRQPATPGFAAPVLVLSLGLALSALWEMGEWLGHNFIDDEIFVGYDDTLGDLAMGGAGAILAGLALPYFAARSRVIERADREASR